MKSYEKTVSALGADRFEPHTPEVPIKVKDAENCRLNAVILSDLHLSQTKPERTENIFHCINDLSFAKSRIDVLTFAGDLTDNGRKYEYRYLADRLKALNTVDHIIPVTGNHDIRFGAFSSTLTKFARFCEDVNNRLKVPGLWYSYEVNGYTFIVLGSTKRRFEEATLSKDELLWLEKKLCANDMKNRPVFIMLHQPLKKTHNLPNSWDMPGTKAGSVGDESDMLSFILGMHQNVFLITGHLHRGYNKYTFEERHGIRRISVRAAGLYNKDSDYADPGLGFTMEVYDNEVVFRARNFIKGRYIIKQEKSFELSI